MVEGLTEICKVVRQRYPDEYYTLYILRIDGEEKVVVEKQSEETLENFAKEVYIVLDENNLPKDEDDFLYSIQTVLEIRRFKGLFGKYKDSKNEEPVAKEN